MKTITLKKNVSTIVVRQYDYSEFFGKENIWKIFAAYRDLVNTWIQHEGQNGDQVTRKGSILSTS